MMNSSFGSSTSTMLATPTPADRRSVHVGTLTTPGPPPRPFAASSLQATRPSSVTPSALARAPAGSGSASSSNTHSLAQSTPAKPAGPLKAVRFSPGFPQAGPAPPTRVQSYTPSHSPQQPTSYLPSHVSTTSSAPPAPRPASALVQHQVAAALTPVAKSVLPPLGRGDVARRLRVNSLLLVAWWIAGRTNLYSYASGHLVQIVPALDAPLHFLETALFLLLCYNIGESMYALNRLSTLPASTTYGLVPSHMSPRRTPAVNRSPFSTPPATASPKTRSSPAMLPSPSLARSSSSIASASPFRASSRNSPNGPPTPQTPSSVPRMATALRRSTLPHNSTPSPKVAPDADQSLLTAFYARHSPSAGGTSPINSRLAIDRLLDD